MSTLRTLAAGALAAAALAAPAQADSISYVKDGDVFLATPDGAQTVRVTSRGGYSSASQADDGRIVALHGSRLHLLDRYGEILADFTPVGQGTAGSITFNGPFDPAISPDGSRIAYGFYVQYKSGDPNCGRPGGCMSGQLYAGTGYTRSTGATEWGEPGFRPEYGWVDPSWIDDSRTLISAPSSGFVTESAIDTAGDDQNAMQWFSDNRVGNLYDGEMNRQGTAVAFVGNTESDRLLVNRVTTAPAKDVAPEGCLDAPAQGGRWSSPTWSPDGERLAFAGPAGIYVAQLTGIATGCPDASKLTVETFAPGAVSPDWGPAGLPAPKAEQPRTGGGAAEQPTTTPQGPTTPTTQQPTDGPAALRLSVAGARLSTALQRGLLARVRCAGTGTVAVRATLGARTVARGSGRCAAGAAAVRVRFTAAARRTLRGRRTVALSVRAASAGGEARTTVRLRR